MDILQSVSTLQAIYQISNLTPWLVDQKTWTLRRCHLLEIYTVAVIFGASGLLLYGLFADDNYMKTSVNEIGVTVDFIQLVGIRVAHIVSITEALRRRNDQKVFYDELKQIDKIFEISLNVDVNNGKFRRKTLKRGLLIFGSCMVCECFILISHLLSDTHRGFYIYWICYLLPMLICGLRYFQIFTSIRVLQRRFDKLVKVLHQINFVKDQSKSKDISCESFKLPLQIGTPTLTFLELPMKKKSASCYSMENSEMKRLLIIRDLYNRLFALTELFNRFFGISILINVGNDFISITSNCYWIFITFKNYSGNTKDFLQIAGSTVWSVPHLLNLLILAILCEKTMKSTTSIALGLHRIPIDTLNDNHNSVIQQFSLQLLHQKISITAAGFFSIDCSLLYTIVGATTTYLIILIQFHLNEAPAD